jgi:uncharacterized protein
MSRNPGLVEAGRTPGFLDVAGGVQLAVRVMPRAPQNAIDGVRNGRLVLRVTAAPVDGAANEGVCRLLADALSVPRRDVTVLAGQTSRNKTVRIDGLSVARLLALTAPDSAGAPSAPPSPRSPSASRRRAKNR